MLLAVLFANSEGNILVERYAGSSSPLIFLDLYRLFFFFFFHSTYFFAFLINTRSILSRMFFCFFFFFAICSLVILVWNATFLIMVDGLCWETCNCLL